MLQSLLCSPGHVLPSLGMSFPLWASVFLSAQRRLESDTVAQKPCKGLKQVGSGPGGGQS